MNTFVSALGALGALSFVGTIITAFAQRRKVRAEAAKTGADAASVLTDSALDAARVMMSELRSELAAARDETGRLRRELAGTRDELDALRGHLHHVEGTLRNLGAEVPAFQWPPPTPEGRAT